MPPNAKKFHPAIRRVVDEILLALPGVLTGSMFGHPGYYVQRRLVACHYGTQVGIKVSEEMATALLRLNRAKPFQPYGKSPMRCWVALSHPRPTDFHRDRDLFVAAVAFAKGSS